MSPGWRATAELWNMIVDAYREWRDDRERKRQRDREESR